MRKPIGTIATIVAALIFTNHARANLVSNGGFETGNFLPEWTQGGDPDSTGVDASSFFFSNSGTHEASFGPQNSDPAGFGTISQTINTDPGANYTLSYYIAAVDDDEEDEVVPALTFDDYVVDWNGNQIFEEGDLTDQPYVLHQFSVTATGPTTTVEFGFYNAPGFFLLDDVSVEPTVPTAGVPEPVTATLGLLSLGGLGLATLRRRAR